MRKREGKERERKGEEECVWSVTDECEDVSSTLVGREIMPTRT